MSFEEYKKSFKEKTEAEIKLKKAQGELEMAGSEYERAMSEYQRALLDAREEVGAELVADAAGEYLDFLKSKLFGAMGNNDFLRIAELAKEMGNVAKTYILGGKEQIELEGAVNNWLKSSGVHEKEYEHYLNRAKRLALEGVDEEKILQILGAEATRGVQGKKAKVPWTGWHKDK